MNFKIIVFLSVITIANSTDLGKSTEFFNAFLNNLSVKNNEVWMNSDDTKQLRNCLKKIESYSTFCESFLNYFKPCVRKILQRLSEEIPTRRIENMIDLVKENTLACETEVENFQGLTHPSLDFTHHRVVEPTLYHGKHGGSIKTSKELNGRHTEHLMVELMIGGDKLLLDLVLSKQLLSSNFFHRYKKNGTDIIHKHSDQDIELCEYYGKVRNIPNSWAALSTCDGVNGVIYDGSELHYISKDWNTKERSSRKLDTKHFLYSHSNLADEEKKCGFENEHHGQYRTLSRNKRNSNESTLIYGPYNSNNESSYVELLMVIDHREYKSLGENRQRVIQHCKAITNIVNGLYSQLNVFVALVGVVIWSEKDEIDFSTNGDETLSRFLMYRRDKLMKDHPNDNAQLLGKFEIGNKIISKSLKGPICSFEYSGGVNRDFSPVIGLVATSLAHSLGHNLGMEHDTRDCQCPENHCIMSTMVSQKAPFTQWSSCSRDSLKNAFAHGMNYCLKNKPKALFDGQVCGNGFLEPGEECDCGLPEYCNNNCCNPNTCMLLPNASCATGECCDLSSCSLKTEGVLCRFAQQDCDLPEYCTGKSEFCPTDVYKMNTEDCDGGKAYCFQGSCKTRTGQCKILWGVSGRSSEEKCYEINVKGNKYGNCGYNRFNRSFTSCQNEDILCGRLHCQHLNDRLEFGLESTSILVSSFISEKGRISACRSATIDLGVDEIDPGMVPNGAPCGNGKMCLNQKCVSVEDLRKEILCPDKCNDNGWCNNLGQCHCKNGFLPPYCQPRRPQNTTSTTN